jgi:hypothetical protein
LKVLFLIGKKPAAREAMLVFLFTEPKKIALPVLADKAITFDVFLIL